MKEIQRVKFIPQVPKRKKVAAYCRVSTGKDAMLHSLATQVSFYRDLIQNNGEWEFAGVFYDEAISGTKTNRPGFTEMMNSCRAGNIDMIIVKSISRFARNTVMLLDCVRELKALNVDVYFEEQNIHSLSADGELVLTFLASFAQEEARSVSENMKWRVRKNFSEGRPWHTTVFGYRYKDGAFVVYPAEAEIVKRIFDQYISGMGFTSIAKGLTADKIPTFTGGLWSKNTIQKLLTNYTYTGNLMLQKTFNEDFISKRKADNTGQLPMYIAEGTHEAIVPVETFELAQALMAERSKKECGKKGRVVYKYSTLIICGKCGKHYRRKVSKGKTIWLCSTLATYGKSYCESKQIPEIILDELTAEFEFSKITQITAVTNDMLEFHFDDGTSIRKKWKNRSRADSWTPEMKERARQKEMERQANG